MPIQAKEAELYAAKLLFAERMSSYDNWQPSLVTTHQQDVQLWKQR